MPGPVSQSYDGPQDEAPSKADAIALCLSEFADEVLQIFTIPGRPFVVAPGETLSIVLQVKNAAPPEVSSARIVAMEIVGKPETRISVDYS